MSTISREALELEKTAAFNSLPSAAPNTRIQEPYRGSFLSLSDMQIPNTPTEIFKWSKYFFMFDPLISGAVMSLASYPVTEMHLEDIPKEVVKEVVDSSGDLIELTADGNEASSTEESDILKTYKRVLFDKLKISKLCIEIGIDYYLYGNCFIIGDFEKNEEDEWEWGFVRRLDPADIIIDINEITGKKKYKWRVPQSVRTIVNNKSPKEEYDEIPDNIKQAVRENKVIVLNSDKVYHFQRATDSGGSSAWGTPIVANVMKLLIYRNTLRRAQEAIANEHIVPLRIYYLSPVTGSANPMAQYNETAGDLATQLMTQARDPNYKIVSPVPVSMTTAGGQGRGLMVTQEIEQVQDEILAGMRVPREFVFGGVSYSGSTISLRILENHFATYRLLLIDFLQNFLIKGMALKRGEIKDINDDNVVTIKMNDLKMQDDIQQKQLIVQLNSQGKISNDFLWKMLEIDPDAMQTQLDKEAIDAINSQSDITEKQMRLSVKQIAGDTELKKKEIDAEMELNLYRTLKQMELQEKMAEIQMSQGQVPGMQDPMMGEEFPDGLEDDEGYGDQIGEVPSGEDIGEGIEEQEEASGVDIKTEEDQRAFNLASQIRSFSDEERQSILNKMTPVTRQKVEKFLSVLDEQKEAEESMEVDMSPYPNERPPRREGGI